MILDAAPLSVMLALLVTMLALSNFNVPSTMYVPPARVVPREIHELAGSVVNVQSGAGGRLQSALIVESGAARVNYQLVDLVQRGFRLFRCWSTRCR